MSEIAPGPSPDQLHRISFTADTLALTPREIAAQKPLSRFDDPRHEYRVLYAATNKVGAAIETLQDLRPSLAALDALRRVMQNDIGFAQREPRTSTISDPWILQRYAGAIVPGRPLTLVDLSDQRTIAALREPLAAIALQRGMTDLSAASFMGADRAFTTAASRVLYEMPERYDGIFFQSALGTPYTNVGLFEDLGNEGSLRAPLSLVEPARHIERDDPALLEALKRLDLALGPEGIELTRDVERARDDDHELAR